MLQYDGVASPSDGEVLVPIVGPTRVGHPGVAASAVDYTPAPTLFTIGSGDGDGLQRQSEEEEEPPRFTSDSLFVTVSPRHSPNTGDRRRSRRRSGGRGRGKGAEADAPPRPRDARLRPKPKKTVRPDM